MRRRHWPAILLLLPWPNHGHGQSLADVAKKDKERRKQTEQDGAPTRVISDEDLAKGKGRLASDPRDAAGDDAAAPASPSPRASTTARGEDEGDVVVMSEVAWRTRAVAARNRLEKAQKLYETLSSQHLAQGEYFVDDNGRTLIGSPEALQKLVAQAKARVDAAQKAWDDLEESARRQRVPPGWLR